MHAFAASHAASGPFPQREFTPAPMQGWHPRCLSSSDPRNAIGHWQCCCLYSFSQPLEVMQSAQLVAAIRLWVLLLVPCRAGQGLLRYQHREHIKAIHFEDVHVLHNLCADLQVAALEEWQAKPEAERLYLRFVATSPAITQPSSPASPQAITAPGSPQATSQAPATTSEPNDSPDYAARHRQHRGSAQSSHRL